MGEERTEGAQPGKEYLTVGEAARLLNVHRNTIHHRIKTGRIKAHKVVEADREVYRIERDSLDVGRTSAHVHTLDAQRTTASEELARIMRASLDEIVRPYMDQLGDLREQIGAERARRQMAEERAAALEAELEALRAAPGAPQSASGPVHEERPFTEEDGPQEGVQRRWWEFWR